MWIHLLHQELIDGAGPAEVVAAAAVVAPSGVRGRHRFLRRGPKLPWDEADQEEANEQVVIGRSKRRRVKLPAVVREALADAGPVASSIAIDAPQIKIPAVGTAKLQIRDESDPEEESVIMALLH